MSLMDDDDDQDFDPKKVAESDVNSDFSHLDDLEVEIVEEDAQNQDEDTDNLEPHDDSELMEEEEPSPPQRPQKTQSRAEKRIRELNRRAKEAEARAAAAERRIEELAHSESVAQYQANQNRVQSVRNYEATITQRERVLRNEWNKATEEGDTEKQWSIQGELADLKARRLQLDAAKRELGIAPDGSYTPPEPPKRQAPPQPRSLSDLTVSQIEMLIKQQEAQDPRAGRWFRQHKDWFFTNASMRDTALTINQAMIEEGMDVNSDQFYVELNRRISQTFPSYFGSKTSKQQVKSPIGGSRGTPPAGSSGNKVKVQLSREEKELAKRMDVSLEDWAKYKARIEREKNL